MSLSDEEKAALIIKDQLESMMVRIGIWFAWSVRQLIVGMVVAGRISNTRSSRSVNIPELSTSEKSQARDIAARITDFGEG